MDILFKIALILHIVGGSIGLLSGFVNMLRKKGDKNHVLVGRIFFYSMMLAGFSALLLSVLHPNYFLCMVGVFTLYMVSTGNRYIYFKLLSKNNEKPKLIDWLITYIMFIAGLLFMGFGIWFLTKSNSFGWVFLAFGFFGLVFVKQDFTNYKGESKFKNYWLVAHLQRMTGGFIAASTAFLVVNAKYIPLEIPGFIYWLLPTAVFTPLIIMWSSKWEVKKK
jgi:uncharacterized membrane protein